MRTVAVARWTGVGVCLALTAAIAAAQDSGRRSIALPTGNPATSVLQIETTAPAEARVGQEFQYEVHLKNISDHVALTNLRIEAAPDQGVEIVRIEGLAQNGDQGQQPKRQAESQQWQVHDLKPGEQVSARVTAIGERQGEIATCLRFRFEPAVCMMTRFTEPEIAVGKSSPDIVSVCHPIEYRYRVYNTGTGITGKITLHDPLPQGFKTADGKDEVRFELDRLAPNTSHEFTARVWASDRGEFASRARVETAEGLEAHSNRPTTKVTAPRLAVEAHGPSVVMINETATYEVVVRNEGDAVAEEAVLDVEIPEGFRVVDRANRQADADENETIRTFRLGNIAPGAEQRVWIRTAGKTADKTLGYSFVASSACARGDDIVKAQQAEVRTDVIARAALLLTLVDRDPVRVGEDGRYSIRVLNQGNAKATDVVVTAEMPDQFISYRESHGPTKAEVEGRTLKFAPVEELAPGDMLEWHVIVRAERAGQVRFRAEVNSNEIDEPGVALEPTMIYGGDQQQGQGQSESKEPAAPKKTSDDGQPRTRAAEPATTN